MAIFPTEKMAEKYARRICLKLKEAGKVSNVEDCVAKVKTKYSDLIKDIDDKWTEGIMARYGLS